MSARPTRRHRGSDSLSLSVQILSRVGGRAEATSGHTWLRSQLVPTPAAPPRTAGPGWASSPALATSTVAPSALPRPRRLYRAGSSPPVVQEGSLTLGVSQPLPPQARDRRGDAQIA